MKIKSEDALFIGKKRIAKLSMIDLNTVVFPSFSAADQIYRIRSQECESGIDILIGPMIAGGAL